ncbi:hypothetical protein Tco_0432140 [Tanacetum coccineum]
MTHPYPNRRFIPQEVLTKYGKINTACVSVNTVVRPINTTGSKPTVNHPRPISNAYKKGYSQVTRPFNKYSTNKNSIFNKKVNTVRVKDTTAKDKAVGNPQQKEYKEKGVIDSGCSRHMTGNKCYLTEYEDYDGGFVSFGDRMQETLLVDSKLPTTFGVKRLYCLLCAKGVLVIKPIQDTLWNLLRGRTPLIDFMKPFGCLVTILNTRDHLGKFDGKADEGFFVGNQTNGIAGTRDNIVTDHKVSEEDAEEKPTEMDKSRASDKDGEDDQATRRSFTPVSAAGPSFTNDDPSSPVNAAEASNAFEEHLFERFSPFKNAFTLPPVSNVTPMDDTRIFGNAYDDEDVGAEADLNNLETTMNVSPIPTTRIDKDHPKDQIIGDFNSAIQTRRMTKISDEHAMIEAMQEELLQNFNFRRFGHWLIYLMARGPLEPNGSLETRQTMRIVVRKQGKTGLYKLYQKKD